MVAAARRQLPLRTGCLPRTVVLWTLLRRLGIDSDLRIGVRGDTHAEFQAHAWLEWNGEVLNDAGDVARQYLPFNGPAFDSVELQSTVN